MSRSISASRSRITTARGSSTKAQPARAAAASHRGMKISLNVLSSSCSSVNTTADRLCASTHLLVHCLPRALFPFHVRVVPFIKRFRPLHADVVRRSLGAPKAAAPRVITLYRSIIPPIFVFDCSLKTVLSHTGHFPSFFPAKPTNGLFMHMSHMMQPQFNIPRLPPRAASPFVLHRGLGQTKGS